MCLWQNCPAAEADARVKSDRLRRFSWRFQMVTDCWGAFLGEPFHSIFLVEIDRNSQGCPANENKFQKLFFIKYLPINLGVILFTPLVKTVKIIQKQTMGVLEQQRRHH
jgi:hypothetical protein